jgi:hypothetical protein
VGNGIDDGVGFEEVGTAIDADGFGERAIREADKVDTSEVGGVFGRGEMGHVDAAENRERFLGSEEARSARRPSLWRSL